MEQVDISKDFFQGIEGRKLTHDFPLKAMKPGDIIMAEGYTLYDAMSATELFDIKIDSKLGLQSADTPQKLLSENKIKRGSQLTDQELQDRYQFDETLWDNDIVACIFKYLNTTGNALYNLIKNSPYLREEDYNPNIFSFKSDSVSLQELIAEVINKVDSEVQSKIKKKKTIQPIDGISARLKLLKGLANIFQQLCQPYSEESHKQIVQQIDFIRKRMDIIVQTGDMEVDMSNYESQTIFKHIRALISIRRFHTITFKESITYVENFLQQLETVLEIAQDRDYLRIFSLVDTLVHKSPKNIIVRAYLETNLFKFDPLMYFQQTPFVQLIQNQVASLFPAVKDQLTDSSDAFKSYQDYLVSICHECLVKQLRGAFRQMRDFHKVYQHFSVLIHESVL